MKKIVFVSKHNAQLLEEKERTPQAGEVKIKLCYTAISAGTERALITGNDESDEIFRYGFPSASGYSGSGVICEVGEGVVEYKIGDRVMVHGGGHQQYCTVALNEIVKVPDNVDLKQASMVIISGFSLAAVRKVKIDIGKSCMVVGLGLLGLFSVQYAKLCGAYPVIASDFSAERRELALSLGADYALDPSDENYTEKVKELSDGGVNTAIEVTGNPKALKQTLSATAKFGKVALLGCTRTMTEIDFYHDVHWPGIELIGAHSGARAKYESHSGMYTEMDDCAVTLKYLSAGRLDFSKMISTVISPTEAHSIYKRLATDKNFPLGVIFDWENYE